MESEDKKETVILDKPLGITPLEAITMLRISHPVYSTERIAYAGRLDPMASGLLLLLVGDECKNRDAYEKLDKSYEFEVLIGIETDTYDTLGLITKTDDSIVRSATNKDVVDKIGKGVQKNFTGKIELKYPPYSSFRVNGQPLLYWARNNRLDEIEIPSRVCEIKKMKYLGHYFLEESKLLKEVTKRIGLVSGDFRQPDISSSWETELKNPKRKYPVLKFQADVTSGTYIRSLTMAIAKHCKTVGLSYNIRRTRVGDYTLENVLDFK